MGGDRIVPRNLKTKGNKICSQPREIFFSFLNRILFIFAKNSFFKMSTFILLSLTLSGITFSLVSD